MYYVFREHYFVTTSMSKLRVTEKRCKVLLQLNSIAEAYHHKESINTKMARAKKNESEKYLYSYPLYFLRNTPLFNYFRSSLRLSLVGCNFATDQS